MRVIFLAALAAGCLGEATVNQHDLSATVFDLAEPIVLTDMTPVGDAAGLYNCGQLNACEIACASDPKPSMCVATCRARATSQAVTKDMQLQACFNQYCPPITDAGTMAVCTPGDAGISSQCQMCVLNSQIQSTHSCTSIETPPECHQCFTQADACRNDK